jgi:hypothetical protein
VQGVAEIYSRAFGLARAVPWIVALVFAGEFLQHVAEIRLGMYRGSGELAGDAASIRLAFGAVKILCIVLALLFALRWWRFEGDSRRGARPTLALLKGLALFILVDLGAETLAEGIAVAISRLAGPLPAAWHLAVALGPIAAWTMLATYLYPWFVGLLTEDRTMTLRRSILGISGRYWSSFGLFVSGWLPAMILHYLLGYAAFGRSDALIWVLMVLDSGLVAMLALLLASADFTLYRRAAERVPAAAEAAA